MNMIKSLIFVCDAGMVSSIMGAVNLRKYLCDVGIRNVSVEHAPVSDIPSGADIIVAHRALEKRLAAFTGNARTILLVDNFFDINAYEPLLKELQ